MSDDIKLPDKPRKHRWVTEALNQGESILSVWPSEDEVKDGRKKERFLEVIAKIGNDPRVSNIVKMPHNQYSVVYLFHLDD
jgi:hypothetical protein